MFSERDYNRSSQQGGGMMNFWKRRSIVFNLIVINIVCFGLSKLFPDIFLRYGALIPRAVVNGEVWRAVTYLFLYGGFWHIFFNMYMLWLYGTMVERELGRSRFLTIYFLSGLLGAAFFILANLGTKAWCIGASGATYGVMMAAAMLYPNAVMTIFPLFIPIRLKNFVLICCAIDIAQYLLGGVSIAHLAHLGGAIGAFFFMRKLGFRSILPRWMNNLFSRKTSRYKSTSDSASSSSNYSSNSYSSTYTGGDSSLGYDPAELNRILDKMSRQGYQQLTELERETLRNAGTELKRRRQASEE